METITLGALSSEPVGLQDRFGKVWKADPDLSVDDAYWLFDLQLQDQLPTEKQTADRLLRLVVDAIRVHQPDVVEEEIRRGFKPGDLLGILQAFLVHSGRLPTSKPKAPKKASKTSSTASPTG